MTPAQLRKLAAGERARAARARATAEEAERLAEALERAADARAGLSTRDQAATVTIMNPVAHGLATSKGRSKDPLAKAAQERGFSLRRLAPKVGLHTHTLLSMARVGKRSIKREVAEKIEQLTGFAATPANWPGGIVD